MTDKYILAIDLGTSGPKVALFSSQGELLGGEFEEVRLLLFEDGGAEQVPDEWWQAVDKAAKRLLARGLVPVEDIVAISSTGQWSGTVAVDADGNAIGNAVIWMDSRGAPYIHQMAGGPLSGYAPGKLLRWIRLTAGAPAVSGKDPIAHILYLKHIHSEIYQRAHKFLEPIDYIGFRLTGRMAASFDSITLHWLTDNRDISNVKYDEGLIRLAGLDRSKLPDLQSANSVLGPLHADVARAWGLRPDVKVVIGSPDVHSASIGSGAVHDFESHVYIGTSSWLTCHVPFKKTDIFHGLASLPSAIPGRYLQTNAQECAGVCLTFLRDNVLYHKDALGAGEKPGNVYRLFDEIVARTPAGSGRVLFLPWLYGERAPIDDRYARGGFFNLSLSSTRAEMVRAVFEGVAFNSRWLLKYVEIFNGRRAEAVNMVGGGARSDIWCQIFADIFDRPIRQMKDPIEVNVRGAALLAAAAMGFIKYEDIGAHVPVANIYQPNPENRKLYDELFKEFVALYEGNKNIFARLNRVV